MKKIWLYGDKYLIYSINFWWEKGPICYALDNDCVLQPQPNNNSISGHVQNEVNSLFKYNQAVLLGAQLAYLPA